MAKTLKLLKLMTIFSYLIFLLLTLHSQRAISFEVEEIEDEEYILDSVSNILNNATETRRSRFLITSSVKTIKKGTQCQAKYNPCNGVSANKGKSLLYCCKKHCRDVRGDRNNCGRCGRKCNWNERCCGGVCVNVFNNRNHCGKCDKKCKNGVKCSYGFCGYA